MNKVKVVLTCGKLYVRNKKYFLLHPNPVVRDSWQLDHQQRWIVVPDDPVDTGKIGVAVFPIYPSARHLVCSYPVIEYNSSKTILVRVDADDAAFGEKLDSSEELYSWVDAEDISIQSDLSDETGETQERLEDLRSN